MALYIVTGLALIFLFCVVAQTAYELGETRGLELGRLREAHAQIRGEQLREALARARDKSDCRACIRVLGPVSITRPLVIPPNVTLAGTRITFWTSTPKTVAISYSEAVSQPPAALQVWWGGNITGLDIHIEQAVSGILPIIEYAGPSSNTDN